MIKKIFNSGEVYSEYSNKLKKEIPVLLTEKFMRDADYISDLIKIRKFASLREFDFIIQMKEGKEDEEDVMEYTGLVITHNGCLKINDSLPAEKRFRPNSVVIDKEGYNNSLVCIYVCEEQGIFEIGEVNNKTLKKNYPYSIALEKCFDRVVLKNSKLYGIVSESETAAEERQPDPEQQMQMANDMQPDENIDYMKEFIYICNKYGLNKRSYENIFNLDADSSNADYFNACNALKKEIES